MPKVYALVGGGSGGHVVPLLPVAKALKERDPECMVVHIGHTGDPFNRITREYTHIDEVHEVSAGKYRRYHGQSLLAKLLDVKTMFFNARDLFRFLRGYRQSRRLLKRLQPTALFMKGGYVCAGVGFAAGKLGFPYITHDSDAMVSLAHKLIAKRAQMHLTAVPPENYPEYEQQKTRQVGVPLRDVFREASLAEQQQAKQKLGFKTDQPVVLVTGGGLGARVVNEAAAAAATSWFSEGYGVIHLTGNKLHKETEQLYDQHKDHSALRLIDFSDDMHELSTRRGCDRH